MFYFFEIHGVLVLVILKFYIICHIRQNNLYSSLGIFPKSCIFNTLLSTYFKVGDKLYFSCFMGQPFNLYA